MKLRYFLVLLVLPIFFLAGTSFAIPSGYPPIEFGLELDKVLYNPGDTVMIHVWGGGATPDNSTVYLKIKDAATDISGTNLVYQETKNLVNNEARFNYTIPIVPYTSNPPYRFLVLVYQNQDDSQPLNGVYFVTKDGAQRLVISSVTVLNPMVNPGQLINFTASVTDGLQNPMSQVSVVADLPKTNGGGDYLRADATYDKSIKLFKGLIPVPDSWKTYTQQLGIYNLRIAATPHYLGPLPMNNVYSNKGFFSAENSTVTVQIIQAGSNSVPEFPFAVPVMLIGIVSVMIFYRIRIRK